VAAIGGRLLCPWRGGESPGPTSRCPASRTRPAPPTSAANSPWLG